MDLYFPSGDGRLSLDRGRVTPVSCREGAANLYSSVRGVSCRPPRGPCLLPLCGTAARAALPPGRSGPVPRPALAVKCRVLARPGPVSGCRTHTPLCCSRYSGSRRAVSPGVGGVVGLSGVLLRPAAGGLRGCGRVGPVRLVVVLVCVMGWCGFVVGWWASLLVGAAGWRPGPLWRPGSPGWCLGFRGLRSGGPSCGLFGSCLWSWPAVSGWLPSLCCFGVWLCGVAVSGVLLLPRLCRCLPPGRDGAGWLDLPGGGGGGGGGGRGGGVGVGVGLGGVGGLVWGRGGGVK
ncbi:hypothetical protein C9F11_42135 [Streptomyces sp. YIM 121038]|nr:hypothetical protein C9F11_42135 [Streptomyces sp. YIM 121038]